MRDFFVYVCGLNFIPKPKPQTQTNAYYTSTIPNRPEPSFQPLSQTN